MPRQYSHRFRGRVAAFVESGGDVSYLAGELGIARATIYRRQSQARIDAGEIVGVNSEMASE